MDWQTIHVVLVFIQHLVSLCGILIIVSGVFVALSRYFIYFFNGVLQHHETKLNDLRLSLGRTLILGLEFIVAADLIGTTTTPDYYSVGLLAIIVVVRTILSFSINREIMSLTKHR